MQNAWEWMWKNPLAVKDLVILENLLKVNTGTKTLICFKDSRMVGKFILTRELVLPKYDLRSIGILQLILCNSLHNTEKYKQTYLKNYYFCSTRIILDTLE